MFLLENGVWHHSFLASVVIHMYMQISINKRIYMRKVIVRSQNVIKKTVANIE